VIGVDVGPAEDLEFWRAFLRQLVTRGLRGVRLVTSDSHLGLKQAVGGGRPSIGAGGGGHLPRHPRGAPPVSRQDQLASLVAGPQVLDWAGPPFRSSLRCQVEKNPRAFDCSGLSKS
jgi:hypothetical protein